MSIGSRTVKGIFILGTIYLFSSNSLSGVAILGFCKSCGAQFLYMQGISVNNSYFKLYRVSPVVKMI